MSQNDTISRRIITEVFIIGAAVILILIFIFKLTSHNFSYVESILGTQETIADEISNDEIIVNINTAGIEEFMTLDGIGEVTAQKIIDYRESNNGFMTIEELLHIEGIGEAKLKKIKNYVTLE